MTLDFNNVSEANLEIETEQAQKSVRFAQDAENLIRRLRLLKDARKDSGGFLSVREFVAVFEGFGGRGIAGGKTAFFERLPFS
jgi:hypothetical protein